MTLQERFWAKVDKSRDCWTWTDYCTSKGYGRIRVDERIRYAHRVSYEMHVGPIPEGLQVRHHCDNPSCVRPDHMTVGTSQDNSDDMVEHGRALTGEVNPMTPLSEADVREIKRLYRDGEATQYDLADRYGVGQNTISRIVRGETWAHVEVGG